MNKYPAQSPFVIVCFARYDQTAERPTWTGQQPLVHYLFVGQIEMSGVI